MPESLSSLCRDAHAGFVAEYGLTKRQAAALPSLEYMLEIMRRLRDTVLAPFLESLFHPDAIAWMQNPTLEGLMRGPREIKLTPAQNDHLTVLKEITGFIAAAGSSDPASKAAALKDYERLCRAILPGEHPADASPLTPLENVLATMAPLPPSTPRPTDRRRLRSFRRGRAP